MHAIASLMVLATLLPSTDDRPSLIGTRATDLEGRSHVLGGVAERRPVALVFYATECPVSNRYVPRLSELRDLAQAHGVELYAVLSDPLTSVARAGAHRDVFEIRYPILFDASGDLAARLRPTHVPEAFVFSAAGELVYRGRIDDHFAAVGKPRRETRMHDLRDAILAVADGKTVASARTEPVGCIFEAWDGDALPSEVTWTRDVAPILNANCLVCHREGEVAPFPLASYEDARRRARMLAMVCEERIMPPWRAVEGFGSFRNERHLSEREIALLASWAENGAPRGADEDLLPPPRFEDAEWRLGTPDLIVRMPVEVEIPAEGDDVYRCFVIPLGLEDDTMVVGAEFHPGDASVVHHAISYLDDSGRAQKLDARDPEPGYSVHGTESPGFWPSGSLGGWSPGAQPYRFPDGFGSAVDEDEVLVLEVHYHPTGRATTDRSEVGLYFADGPVKEVEDVFIGTEQIDIAAGEAEYWRHVWMELPTAVTLLDITPHAHYLGKEFHVAATLPGGGKTPLIRIDEWDFRWQETYVYAQPVRLPAGTRIDARIRFDNSAANPFNPNTPPARVTEGWQTTDEMCLVYMSLVPDDPRQTKRLWGASLASFMRDAAPSE